MHPSEHLSPNPAPESPKAGESLALGVKTVEASAHLGQDIADGKSPSPEHLDELSTSIADDLSQAGVPVDGKEIRDAAEVFQIPDTQSPVPESVPTIPKLSEYLHVLKDVEHTYGIDKHKGKLIAGTSTLVGLSVADAAVQYLYFDLVDRLTGGQSDVSILTNIIDMVPKVSTLKPHERAAFLKKTLKQTAPIWGPLVLNIAANRSEVFARKQFNKFLAEVGATVNKRITETLFMREYSFLENRHPAEVLDIVERGKSATVDLLATTYGDLAPSLATLGASTLPQLKVNTLATALSLVRIPFLYKFSKTKIEQFLVTRQQELAQKDMLDSKIASLLTNLEIAKASGKADTAAKQLESAMRQREQILSGQRSDQAMMVGGEKLINTLFDQVAPWVVGGMEAYNGYKKSMRLKDIFPRDYLFGPHAEGHYEAMVGKIPAQGREIRTNKLVRSAIKAYAKKMEFEYIQRANANTVLRIAELYANHIMPDLQDIKVMEQFLGPWKDLDLPDGAREQERVPVTSLPHMGIRVENLSVKGILRDISFDVNQGELVAIQAPKGTGKTTLLRSLLGLYQPDAGSISYGGVDIDGIRKYGDQSLVSRFGYANQNPGFIDTMTLRDNLILWNKDTVPEGRVEEVMADLGLEKLLPRLDTKGTHYSGGEMRLLSIARALLTNPNVLFLDEPTANLDPASVDKLNEALSVLRRKRPDTTILAVTHDSTFATTCDRSVALENGAHLESEPQEKIFVGSS